YESLKISLHTSGPLMEWLDEHHSDYLDRLAGLVAAGRVEILGGAFYEPILTMIPSRDRIGQITRYTQWLESRLGAEVRGIWIPERVWEPALTSDLAKSNIDYTILDDFHFENAGLKSDDLHGYYVTENDGEVVRVFPGSERLRYLIPFLEPHETIEYIRQVATSRPGAIMVFGDDGEKFGTWPETKQHVYDNGWLTRFFDALVENQDWIHTTTLSDAMESQPAIGKVYIPEGSYREMTEWALPVDAQHELEDLTHGLSTDGRWDHIKRFVRGGNWRSFKTKYPETNEMYARMLMVSRRLEEAMQSGADADLIEQAQRELYRGQCNCCYWHGAFGGTYLPHLRNAVYNHLIAADNLLDQATRSEPTWIEANAGDFNFDDQPEVWITSNKLAAMITPSNGGHIDELDVRSICHNLGATLQRREEAYHRKVLGGPSNEQGECTSIHDRVIFKQDGLSERLQYDSYPRKSMVDHFYPDDVSLDSLVRNDVEEYGDFVTGKYDAMVRRDPSRIQVKMNREGSVQGSPVKITKGMTLSKDSSEIAIAYLLENLPQDRHFHFGVEFNFAGMPPGADDRYFFQGDRNLGHLGAWLAIDDAHEFGLADEWLGLKVNLSANQQTHFWTFPIETVSQSEGGFELVHQSVVLHPHWYVRGDQNGRWSVEMKLDIDTALAESRMPRAEAIVG
ncbi:alpha-amylase/4-alpha-glucanotransferase domain-containing protein, partial [Planctomycetota bacterium]